MLIFDEEMDGNPEDFIKHLKALKYQHDIANVQFFDCAIEL
jgi:hypothetical protein